MCLRNGVMLSSDTLQPRAIKPTKNISPKQIKLDYKITKEIMAMEAALSYNELLFNFIVNNNDTISSTPLYNNNNDNNNTCNLDSSSIFLVESNGQNPQEHFGATIPQIIINEAKERRPSCVVQGRKKRRRRPKVCKNEEESQNQRMTHIAVERNRRKLMNDHLAVLRSLMPESYVQRGDQASIIGGAIDFVKELEHLLQSLEAQKFQQQQESGRLPSINNLCTTPTADGTITNELVPNPFAHFFSYPQCCCSNMSNKFIYSKSNGAVADIEVTLIETHANIRILSRRRLRQLSRMVAGFQTIYLNILHLNVTALDPLVLYSISAKVDEGCVLNSADEIAGAIHLILQIIEEEALAFPYEEYHHS